MKRPVDLLTIPTGLRLPMLLVGVLGYLAVRALCGLLSAWFVLCRKPKSVPAEYVERMGVDF